MMTQLELVLEEIVIARPEVIEQHLCADKGYHGEPASQIIRSNDYVPHQKKRGGEIQEKKSKSPIQTRKMGRRCEPFMVQQVSQENGPIRKI